MRVASQGGCSPFPARPPADALRSDPHVPRTRHGWVTWAWAGGYSPIPLSNHPANAPKSPNLRTGVRCRVSTGHLQEAGPGAGSSRPVETRHRTPRPKRHGDNRFIMRGNGISSRM